MANRENFTWTAGKHHNSSKGQKMFTDAIPRGKKKIKCFCLVLLKAVQYRDLVCSSTKTLCDLWRTSPPNGFCQVPPSGCLALNA